MASLEKKALIELGKSFLRYLWFGLLGLVAAWLTSLTTNADLAKETWSILGQTLPIGTWIVAIVASVVKALDRYTHKAKNIPINGLALPPMQGK